MFVYTLNDIITVVLSGLLISSAAILFLWILWDNWRVTRREKKKNK